MLRYFYKFIAVICAAPMMLAMKMLPALRKEISPNPEELIADGNIHSMLESAAQTLVASLVASKAPNRLTILMGDPGTQQYIVEVRYEHGTSSLDAISMLQADNARLTQLVHNLANESCT